VSEPIEVVVGEERPGRRRRWPLALAAATVLAASVGALALVVRDETAAVEVATVMASTEEPGTARFRVEVEGDDADQAMDGEVDFERRIAHLAVADGSFEGIVTDGTTYTRVPGEPRWLAIDVPVPDDAGTGGVLDAWNPVGILEELRASATSTEELGDDTVREVATERARVTVDSDEEGVPARVDIWVDEDDRLRRLEADLGEGFGRMRHEFWDFGVALDLRVPSPDEVTDDPADTFSESVLSDPPPEGADATLPGVVGPWERLAGGDGVPGGWALWQAPGEGGTVCPSLEVDGRSSWLADIPPPEADSTWEEIGIPTHEGNLVFCEEGPSPSGVRLHGDPGQVFDGVRLVVGHAGADVSSVTLVLEDGGSRRLEVDPATRVFAAEVQNGTPEALRLDGTDRVCRLDEWETCG
jgi:hypothetical protein